MLHKIVKLKDYQLLTLAWLGMLCLVCLNCTVHSLFIAKERVDIGSSIMWSLQEFGIWLLVTPFVCRVLQTKPHLKRLISLGLATLCCVLLVNTILDVLLEQVSWQESLFFNWHKHVIAYIAILCLVYLKRNLIDNDEHNTVEHTVTVKPTILNNDHQHRLQIDEVDIAFADIYFAKAAGNYVELYTASTMTLLRSTMKELQQQLPPESFLRCHRSYLVNLNHSEKLINEKSGHGVLLLTNLHKVPVSKSKRATAKLLLAL